MEHGDPIGGRIHINKFLFTNLAIYLQQKLSHRKVRTVFVMAAGGWCFIDD